jgi:hypothetical protein
MMSDLEAAAEALEQAKAQYEKAFDTKLRIQDLDNLVYPQFKQRFTALPIDTILWARGRAINELRRDPPRGTDTVRAYWEYLSNGGSPFGLPAED